MAAEVLRAPATPAAAAGAAAVPAAAMPPASFKSTALYVGDLAPEVTVDDLMEFFGGKPVNVRICMDVLTRKPLGYGYVNFANQADAEAALELSYTTLRGRPCRVMWSQRDPSVRRSNVGNVFVKNLGPEVTVRELYDSFKLFGPVLSCKVPLDGKGLSLGYGFVQFEDEVHAKAAISSVNGMEWYNRSILATQFVPRPLRAGKTYTNLYVKNVPAEWTDKTLKDEFSVYGEVQSSVLASGEDGKHRGFGFVNFTDDKAAKAAEEALHGKLVEGTPASVPEFLKSSLPSSGMKLYVVQARRRAERQREMEAQTATYRRQRVDAMRGRNVYVRNLDESMTDEVLRKEFSKFGNIESARVARSAEGQSRLFGFVLFSTVDEASAAVAEMHRKVLNGKPLYVQLWMPADDRKAVVNAVRTKTTQRSDVRTMPMPAGMAMPAMPQLAAAFAQGNPAMSPEAAQAAFMQWLNFMVQQQNNGLRHSQMLSMTNALAAQAAMASNAVAVAAAAAAANGGRAGANRRAQGAAGAAAAGKSGASRGAAPAPTSAAAPRSAAAVAARGPVRAGGPTMAQAVAMSIPAATAAVPAVAAAAPPALSFTSQLAAAPPAQRKELIGNRLYTLIEPKESRARKITGMLLEALDETDLLHLLEAPQELDAKIDEARKVLDEHNWQEPATSA